MMLVLPFGHRYLASHEGVLQRLVAMASLLTALGCCPTVFAAPESASASDVRPEAWSFFGGLSSHAFAGPGLHLGAEYAMVGPKRFDVLLSASANAYWVADSESGYALQLRYGQRFTADFGLTWETYLGVGIQYSRWQATVFEFSEAMGVARERAISGLAFIPHVVVGLGYDFRVLGLPLQLYARPGIMFLYPDMNDVVHVAAFGEVGLRWAL